MPASPYAGGIAAISRWLSEATPPVTMWRTLVDPEGIALLRANNYDHPVRHRQMSLESLQDSKIFSAIISGGVAPLNHRLMAEVPPGQRLISDQTFVGKSLPLVCGTSVLHDL